MSQTPHDERPNVSKQAAGDRLRSRLLTVHHVAFETPTDARSAHLTRFYFPRPSHQGRWLISVQRYGGQPRVASDVEGPSTTFHMKDSPHEGRWQ